MSVDRIRSLSCWTSTAIDVAPLAGGITNRNYVVQDGDRKYVVRQCADGTQLGIDRRNERACHRAAAEFGVSPDLIHHEHEFLVSDFVAGRTLSAADLQDNDRLRRTATTLKKLHGAWNQLSGEMLFFSSFQTIRSYAATATASGAQLPADLSSMLADARALESSIAPYQPVLCHNDLLPANLIDTGETVWIVDWELAGIGHPLFDLGGLISNAGLPDALADELMASYGLKGAGAQRELRIFQAMSLLREALWGSVQSVTSTLSVDYQAYAEIHFDKYRAARALVI